LAKNDKAEPEYEGRRTGGASRGGKHADRGGPGGTSRTAKGGKAMGQPGKSSGKHAKDKD
jgi:hypothetical protein